MKYQLFRVCLLLVISVAICSEVYASSTPPVLTGGVECSPGQEYIVMWNPAKVPGPVAIIIWDGLRGTSYELATNISRDDGRYRFRLPVIVSGDRFRIRVVSMSDPSNYVIASGYFSVGQSSFDRKSEGENSVGAATVTLGATVDHGSVKLSSPELVSEVRVYNSIGMLVGVFSTSEGRALNHIDLSSLGLSTGVYLAKLTTPEGDVWTAKFVLTE